MTSGFGARAKTSYDGNRRKLVIRVLRRLSSLVRFGLLAYAILFVCGCTTAQRARDVSALDMPVEPYLAMGCKKLDAQHMALDQQAQSVSVEVDERYRSDKRAELMAWLIFSPAALLIEGNEESAGRLAAIKGQVSAVREAQKANSCLD